VLAEKSANQIVSCLVERAICIVVVGPAEQPANERVLRELGCSEREEVWHELIDEMGIVRFVWRFRV
jgi:hypothetical protein